jgi:uncharacterized membrane protein
VNQNSVATETAERDTVEIPQPVTTSPGLSPGRWVTLAVDVLLLLASLAYIVDPEDPAVDPTNFVLTSLGWVLIAACYAGIRVSRVRRARRGDQRWPQRLAGRRTSYLITLATAIILLGAGLNIATAEGSDDTVTIVKGLSVVMVLLAWAILHLSYAERYARLYLTADDAPLSFPDTTAPTLLEFVYFSFAVGTTFATSDVEVRNARTRGIVLCHGLLAFVYNTAIISMVVGLLTGGGN